MIMWDENRTTTNTIAVKKLISNLNMDSRDSETGFSGLINRITRENYTQAIKMHTAQTGMPKCIPFGINND